MSIDIGEYENNELKFEMSFRAWQNMKTIQNSRFANLKVKFNKL